MRSEHNRAVEQNVRQHQYLILYDSLEAVTTLHLRFFVKMNLYLPWNIRSKFNLKNNLTKLHSYFFNFEDEKRKRKILDQIGARIIQPPVIPNKVTL